MQQNCWYQSKFLFFSMTAYTCRTTEKFTVIQMIVSKPWFTEASNDFVCAFEFQQGSKLNGRFLEEHLWPFSLEPQDNDLYLQTGYIYCQFPWLYFWLRSCRRVKQQYCSLHHNRIQSYIYRNNASIFTSRYVIFN